MEMSNYQKISRTTAIYPNKDNNVIYPLLGILGESGEVVEKVKKILRDKNGIFSNQDKNEISKELGDLLWYLANFATELGLDLGEIAKLNLEKLQDRKNRGTIHGNGDNR